MCGNLYPRALVDLEQKAPGPVAVIAQTIRLRDHRKTNDPRNQTQPYLRIASADLGREARDGESCPGTDRDHHCEERRRRRHRLSKSSRTHQAVARETPKAAESRGRPTWHATSLDF